MRKKPYLQGALDSLCAVYAVVNAAKIISETTEEEDYKLFNDILGYLQEKDLLAKSLSEGITLGLLVYLMAEHQVRILFGIMWMMIFFLVMG